MRGLRVPAGAGFSRKKLDDLAEEAKKQGAAGLVWFKRAAGEVTSPAKKGMAPEALDRVLSAAAVEDGDLLLLVAGGRDVSAAALGALRVAVAKEQGLLDATQWAFCWVTEFPLVGATAPRARGTP